MISVQLSYVSIFTTVARGAESARLQNRVLPLQVHSVVRLQISLKNHSVIFNWDVTRVSQNSFISPTYLLCRSGTFLLRGEGGPRFLRSFWLFPAAQSDISWESQLHGFYRVLHRSSLILDPTGRESKSSQFGPGTCLWGPAIIT